MQTTAPSSPLLLLPLLSLLTTLTPHTAQAQSGVLISYERTDYFIRPSVISFECVHSTNTNGEVTFWRTLHSSTEQVNGSSPGTGSIVFDATPEVEGEYFCSYDGENSSTVEVVAYPLRDSAVTTTRRYTVPLGSSTTLPCVFMPGALTERYTITWFKGLNKINTNDPRFVVNSNFSLSIADVNALDVSAVYYCKVEVENKFPSFDAYRRVGPSMELVVTDSLDITQPLSDVITHPGARQQPAKFTCTAFGLPQPSLHWLHQGRSIAGSSAPEVTVEASGVTVSSDLEFRRLGEAQSGMVECLVMQTGGEEGMVFRSSVASLVVLPSSFRPTLLPTGSGVELSITLPSLLPVSFSLIVYFYSPEASQIKKSELVDPVFSNTRDIKYVIDKENLPTASSFFVRVAIKVEDEEGEASAASNTITVSDTAQSSTTLSDGESCNCSEDESTVQTVLVIFIVFLIVLLTGTMGVAIWGIVLMVKRNRLKSGDSRINFDDRDSIDSKRSRSYSRSQSRSHSRSRSRSHSRSRSRSSSRSRSRSPTLSGSRSRSRSSSTSVSVRSQNHSLYDSKGTLSDREDPEGRHDDEHSVVSSPRSRTDSTARLAERLNSCTALPLPSVPFGYDRHSERARSLSVTTGMPIGEDKENEYEELASFKKGKGHGKEKTHPEPLQPIDCNSEATSDV